MTGGMASLIPDTPKVEGLQVVAPVVEEVKGEEKAQIDESIAAESDEKDKKEHQSLTENCSAKATGPFHLLMLPASEQPKAQVSSIEPMMLMDRKLRRDYLSRRFRAYHCIKKKIPTEAETTNTSNDTKSAAEAGSLSSPSLPMAATTATATTLTNNNTATAENLISPPTSSMELWSGASMLERALVDCCELPPSEPHDDGDSSSSIADDEAPGGSLARGFEVRFAGLVAKHCHSFGSRLLALAILERSLDQDQIDALEADDDNGSSADTDDDNEDENSNDHNTKTEDSESDPENDEEGTDSEQEDSEEESGNEESEDEDEADDDDGDDEYDPNEKASNVGVGKRKQQQKRGRGRPPKRAKTIPKEDTVTLTPPSTRTLRKRVASNTTKTDPATEREEKVTSKAKAKALKTATSKVKLEGKTVAAVEKETHDAKTDTKMNGDTKNEEEKESQLDRMTAFFAAGGLKILRSWLVDSMTPVSIKTPKASPVKSEESSAIAVATRSSSAQPQKYGPSQYGPMLLPLLVLLSKIPFEMKLIVESKINKQIRRLSKQVNGLVDAFKNQKEQPARQMGKENGKLQPAPITLETFVDPAGGAGGCLVIRVQEVLDKLKETWEAHARNASPVQKPAIAVFDPYESIKSKLKERMGILRKFEAGKIEKPDWVSKCEELRRERDKKRPRRKNASGTRTGTTTNPASSSLCAGSNAGLAPPPKANTQQLALKEREAERVALQDKLKAAQEERKAHLQRLKNLNSKRIAQSSSQQQQPPQVSGNDNSKDEKSVKRKKNGKSVKWKDGLSTDQVRKRDILEEVFLLKEEADPSSSSPSSSTNDDNAETTSDEEPEPELSPMKSSADEFGLFEMFDCDETLLL